MNFIEITNRNGHERTLLKVSLIDYIAEERGWVTIYLATRTKSGDQQYIDVEEAYDDIAKTLEDVIGKVNKREEE